MSDPKSGRGRLQEVVVYNTTESNCEGLGKSWCFGLAVSYGRWSHMEVRL